MLAAAPASVEAARVYVFSSGNANQDAALASALAHSGHQSTVGVQFSGFDGTVSLAGFDVAFLQANHNYASPDMPQAGQTRLALFVDGGGGLVTAEWTLWAVAASGYFADLSPLMPSRATGTTTNSPAHTFQQAIAEVTVNAGLAASFVVPGDSFGGTGTQVPDVKSGATLLYFATGQNWYVGVSGWEFGAGRVAQFSQTLGPNFLSDPNGKRLVGNVVEWASHKAGTRQAFVMTATLRYGREDSGGLQDTRVVDGNFYRICRFIVPNQSVAPVTVEFEGQSPFASPSTLTFRTYARMATSGAFSQTLDMYDWHLQAFSPSASQTSPVGTTPAFAAVGSGNPAHTFVGPGNAVRARVQVRQTGPAAARAWCYELDQASWLVRP